ncbi:hypothetical protein C8Q80DRAFT_1097478 [Daedaleopsis nitida]|nr:hypothetical protein C8Q80DRAFT_1097478 [Daedaleopsis nitida]
MSRPNFPIDESYLIGGWLESFFWGLYTLLFGLTIHAVCRRRRDGVNTFLTISTVMLYLLATAHMSLVLVRLIQGFITFRDSIGPVLYFADISVRLNMAKDYIYITSLVVGDLVVVWRLYVVWGRNGWIAVFPVTMTAGELVTGYGSISQWLLPKPNPYTIAHWGTAMFAISLSTNVIVTVAIASRIWCVPSHIVSSTRSVTTRSRNMRIIILVIESGALITAAKLTEFVLFKNAPLDGIHGLNAMYIVYECMPQITGIVPTMIVYAVNNGFTDTDDYHTNTVVLGTRSGAFTETIVQDTSIITFSAANDPFSKAAPAAKTSLEEPVELQSLGRTEERDELGRRWWTTDPVLLSRQMGEAV